MQMICTECGCDKFNRHGKNSSGTAYRFVCKNCGKSVYVPVDAVLVDTSEPAAAPAPAPAPAAAARPDVVVTNPSTLTVVINGQQRQMTDTTEDDLREIADRMNSILERNGSIYTIRPRPATKG